MTTLIPKYDQGSTGAVNRPINQKLAESLSVLDFGADSTGATDSTTAIQNAVNAALALGGATVYFPNGTYILNSNIELGMASYNGTEGAVNIIGESTTRTIIKPGVTGTTALFSITGGNTNYRAFSRIENITIDSGTFKNGNGCAIKIDCTIGNNIKNVIIRNMNYGIWLYAGTSFGGAGWVEYNCFENVTTDYCNQCYRLEQNASNTNPVPSHGYNTWIHCLGNVFHTDSGGSSPQIFFNVTSGVNFYNSSFDFYVSTQDGGTLIYTQGNAGGPLGSSAREGLTPSNTGNFHVESSGSCYVYGTTNFWWSGSLSYVASNFYDYAGISTTYPGQSVLLCDNYVYSGTDLNTSGTIDRFQDAALSPAYPLGRIGKNAPYISVENSGQRKGMVVYADGSDSGAVFGLGLLATGNKLQQIVLAWWQNINGKLLGNKYGYRLLSDQVALTTTPSASASFPVTYGSFIVTVSGTTSGLPSYVFSISKASATATPSIATLSGSPNPSTSETISLTWTSGNYPLFAVSGSGSNGTYNISMNGTL